jgi:hypothetical protein
VFSFIFHKKLSKVYFVLFSGTMEIVQNQVSDVLQVTSLYHYQRTTQYNPTAVINVADSLNHSVASLYMAE